MKALQTTLDVKLNELQAYLQEFGCKYLNAGCFAAGTKLWTPSGYRNVEEIREGDLLYSRSEFDASGPIEAKRVEEVFERFAGVLHLHVAGQVIRTTHEHPFYAHEKGWLAAKELQANDWILSENGDWKAIEDVYDTGEWELVYNLRVADFHTYFVGDESWGWAAWAHNTYLYRGDGAHVPGSGPIGSAINTALILAERAQISFDHVKQTNIGHADSIYKSWTTSFKAAVRFAGNPNRVTKVAEENVASLVLAGVIVVNNSTATRDLIKDHGVNKIAKQASSIKQIMDNNEEVLIEGVVPADVQVSGK